MSSARERLRWLAAAHGIEAGFHDIWGRRHEASDATLRALLADLGVPADSDADVDRELAATHPRYWHRLAEPVVAVDAQSARFEVAVRLARRSPGERIAWRLSVETGASAQGDDAVDALALREASDVHGIAHELRTLAIPVALPPATTGSSCAQAPRAPRFSSWPRPRPAIGRRCSPTTPASGVGRYNSTGCDRRATGASATSATCSNWSISQRCAARARSA